MVNQNGAHESVSVIMILIHVHHFDSPYAIVLFTLAITGELQRSERTIVQMAYMFLIGN